MESLYPLLVIAGYVLVLTLAFGRLSYILPKPKSGEHTRNFTAAAKPSILNKDFKCEVFYPFISLLVSKPLGAFISYSILFLGLESLPKEVLAEPIAALPFVVQVIIGLLVLDLSLYIRHRFVHTWFWSYHAVHHCAKEITWLTTERQHPLDEIVMGIIDFLILYMIGFTAESMVTAIMIREINNLFVHSNIVLDYPKPWKYIFVSPNMHRWHHATEKEAHNTNYCIFFAFFDYLFGTYYVPDNQLPASYGTAYEPLDDIDNKTILKELYLPFVMTWQGLHRIKEVEKEHVSAPENGPDALPLQNSQEAPQMNGS